MAIVKDLACGLGPLAVGRLACGLERLAEIGRERPRRLDHRGNAAQYGVEEAREARFKVLAAQ
jgi:hypothetical protein